MYMNGRAESESDFVNTKVNDDYIKTFHPQKESLSFLQEDAASVIMEVRMILLWLEQMVMILVESEFDI